MITLINRFYLFIYLFINEILINDNLKLIKYLFLKIFY